MKKIISLILVCTLVFFVCPHSFSAGYTVITEPQYNMADSFESTIAKVSKDSKWALLDASGKLLTGFNWDALGDISSYIPAKKGELWGYISPSGKVLIAYQFQKAGSFSDGIALITKSDGTCAYIDKDANEVFSSPFTYSFSPSEGAICGMKDGLYGFCDTEGSMMISPQFDMAYDFHEGYAAVKVGDKWGFITSYGAYSVKPAYDHVSDFKNGFAICGLNGSYGIIDTHGTRTAPVTFDYIGAPDDSGRFPAKDGSVSGYIDNHGKWLLKTEFDFCYPFTDGVARVYDNEKWGYINKDGLVLVEPVFADLGAYHNGLAPFSTDGILWGYLSVDTTPPKEEPPAPSQTPAITPTPPAAEVVPPADTPTVQNPAAGDLPLAPTDNTCISMKIGAPIALYGAGEYALSQAPVLIDGTTMIPVRDVVELLGGSVAWNEKTQRITISFRHRTVSVTIESQICFANGLPTYMPQAPVLLDGVTVVPLRIIVDSLGCTVKWIDTQQNIYIYY